MTELFLRVVNMSLSASVVVGAVLLARLTLRRAPKKWSYLLWSVVGFRLCCPVSLQAMFSLFRLSPVRPEITTAPALGNLPASSMGYIPQSVGSALEQTGNHAIPPTGGAVHGPLPAPTPAAGVEPMEILLWAAVGIWLCGMTALLVYSIVNYRKMTNTVADAVRLRDNVFESDRIGSPFILGFFRPKIYIPYALDQSTLGYVLEHERYHIRRADHVWKTLAYILLCVHWFNPLVWLSFHLMGRDMEMSCDEKVLGDGGNISREYSTTLLSFATERKFPAAAPLAFGETGVKERIRNALNWRRPKTWVTLLAAALCVALVVSCAVNPAGETTDDQPPARTDTAGPELDAYRGNSVIQQDGSVTSGWELWQEFLDKTAAGESASVRIIHYYSSEDPGRVDESIRRDTPVWYVIDVTFDGNIYTVNDGELNRTYRYLMRYEGLAPSPSALYKSYLRYVFTNDNTVTWEDIFHGMVSSQSGAWVEHYTIVTILYDREESATVQGSEITSVTEFAPAEPETMSDRAARMMDAALAELAESEEGRVVFATPGVVWNESVTYDGAAAWNGSGYARGLANNFSYTMTADGGGGSGDELIVQLPRLGYTLGFIHDSDMVYLMFDLNECIFYRAANVLDDVYSPNPYTLARRWFDECEFATAQAAVEDTVIPTDEAEDFLEAARQYNQLYEGVHLTVSPGSMFKYTYVDSAVTYEQEYTEYQREQGRLFENEWGISVTTVFVPENEWALYQSMAGNTAELADEPDLEARFPDAPEGAYVYWRVGHVKLIGDGNWAVGIGGTG